MLFKTSDQIHINYFSVDLVKNKQTCPHEHLNNMMKDVHMLGHSSFVRLVLWHINLLK